MPRKQPDLGFWIDKELISNQKPIATAMSRGFVLANELKIPNFTKKKTGIFSPKI
jgi:hypothetical protein